MGREFDIRKEVELAATPDEVWDAMTTRRGFAGWFSDQEPVPDEAKRSAWDPPRHLRIGFPRTKDGASQAFEYVIEAHGGGRTLLRFVHSGFLGDNWEGEYDFEEWTSRGWDMYLHTLAEYLTHFRGQPAVYITADGPARSAVYGAWPLLRARLGLKTAVMAGDPVRLALEGGLPTIEGVADYVATNPNYLGVRSVDALYRFHGRAGIGMPIAVGHHMFSPDVDAEQTRNAWRSWLAHAFA
jgi:uncharacterized protein YndB with AHSA1/START domain